MERIDKNLASQIVPYFIYKRLELTTPRAYFMFPLVDGYGYFLRSVTVKFPEIYWNKFHGWENCFPLFIEFQDEENNRSKQNDPLRITDFISPGNQGVSTRSASASPPLPGTEINYFAATPLKNRKILNYYYKNGGNINIQITGQSTPVYQDLVPLRPPRVDIVLNGYYCPEKTAANWGNR
jgi:hypothetical protein